MQRMNLLLHQVKKDWIFYFVLAVITIFYFSGMQLVPFHPDESTQLYMSKDFLTLLSNPRSLSYIQNNPITRETRYRALDAPITRYLIGIGRLGANAPELRSDWDWSLSWTENADSGAYPTNKQLFTARISTAFLFPATLTLFYFSFRKIFSKGISLFTVMLLGLHPLVLLHTRRAMAESALLFGICLFLYSLTDKKISPWLIGFALAYSINAKQSAIGLLPVGIIAVCLLPFDNRNLKKMITRSGIVIGVILIISFILNPFYWKEPFSAFSLGIDLRENLSQQQALDHLFGKQLTVPEQLLSGINNLYFRPPSAYEMTSHFNQIQKTLQHYLDIPLHSWGEGFFPGGILIALTLGGLYVAGRQFRFYSWEKKIHILLVLGSSAALLITSVLLLTVPWQRYTVPLLPLIIFWIGYGISPIFPKTDNEKQSHTKH